MAVSIAYLGPAGTYTEMAAMFFTRSGCLSSDLDVGYSPQPTIAQALIQVAEGKADWAVVPVENSVEGSVSMTLDTVWQYPNLNIHQALVLPIDHAFLTNASSLTSIKTVYSHPQGLAQCQRWLDSHLPQVERVPVNSTARAVQLLDGDKNSGAIASLRAASLYKVPVMEHPINDYPGNCTRFWAVSQHPCPPDGAYTSIGFSVHSGNSPGVLVEALQIFAQAGINMIRIESRPTKRVMGDYRFFVDLEGNALEAPLAQALEQLKANASTYQRLGSYELSIIDSKTVRQIMGQAQA